MANFLILHGTDGSPESNWFMWLKGVLVGQGHNVWLPQLPNSDKPDSRKYNKFIFSNSEFKFDENTIIIGHSSGAVAGLQLIANLPDETKLKTAILVSAFKNNLNWDALNDLFIEPLDFDRIKSNCRNITFIHSDNDPYCPLEHAEYLVEKTDGKLLLMKGQGHFNTELGPQYKQFPAILTVISEST